MPRTFGAMVLTLITQSVWAAEPVELTESTYNAGGAVLTLSVNWGRSWKCGPYENAQLQALTFRRAPLSSANAVSIDLKTPSRLFVDNKFTPYAYVIEPGEYILTGFDVKIARSVRDVVHIRGTEIDLVKDGEPTGGAFTVNAGEIVYVGHFGLDCGAEPFLWRYYLESRAEFESWIAQFRDKFPFAKDMPAHFRLFKTTTLGIPFSLPESTIK